MKLHSQKLKWDAHNECGSTYACGDELRPHSYPFVAIGLDLN